MQGFETDDLPCRIAAHVPHGEAEGDFNPDAVMAAKDRRKSDPFIVYGIAAAEIAVADSGWKADTEEAGDRTGVMVGSGIGGLSTIYDTSVTCMNVARAGFHRSLFRQA